MTKFIIKCSISTFYCLNQRPKAHSFVSSISCSLSDTVASRIHDAHEHNSSCSHPQKCVLPLDMLDQSFIRPAEGKSSEVKTPHF